MVGLLVVELVVAGVPAPGGGRNHGPGLPRRVVTWACGDNCGHRGDKGGVSATGLGLGQSSTPRQLSLCSGAPAFPANAINPTPVLRSSGGNPARLRRLREGVLAPGQGKLAGMEGHTQYTQRQSEVNMPRMQLTPPPVIYTFSLKTRAAGAYHISGSRKCESTKSEKLKRGERQT